MEAVVAVVALLFVLFVALGVYATVKVVGAAKRGVDRTVAQARRTVEDPTLRAKTFAQPGPAGETRPAAPLAAHIDAGHPGGAARGRDRGRVAEGVPGLFERLSAHGHELDGELKRLEREPDRARLTERLPALRERTEQITKSADSLRWAARDRAQRFADDDLDSLSTQIDMEAGALRHWTTEPASTGHGSARRRPVRPWDARLLRRTRPGPGRSTRTPEPAARRRPGPVARGAARPRRPADLAGEPRVAQGRGAHPGRDRPARAATGLPLGEEAPPREHHLIPPARPQVGGAGLPPTLTDR